MAGAPVRELDLELDAFEGPFDLMLTLVLKDELPLLDVQVAEVVLAFVERLGFPPSLAGSEAGPEGAARVDLEAIGEFLVLVASLLDLKARELVADGSEPDLGDLDPEEAAAELADRLAAYRRIRAGAAWLDERLAQEGDRYFRLGPAPCAPVRKLEPRAEAPERLAAAIRSLAKEPPAPSLTHLALRLPPVERFLERFRAVLRGRLSFRFDDEVDSLSLLEQAVAFLALLELRKGGEIRLEQAEPFAPITVAGVRAR